MNRHTVTGSRVSMVLRIALFLLSIVMISAGLAAGDYYGVWAKAVMVCMECIGIG